MKNIIFSTIIIFLFWISPDAAMAKKKTLKANFKVEGVCNMCKKRIENAALIKGVKFVDWDKKTKQLAVIYVEGKTSEDAIKKAVAEVGHDAGNIKAKSSDYKKLPACCAYRDGVETH